jgi:hypothetical protein
MKPNVDYSLYLVTDSTEDILGKRDLVDVVGQALQGGKFVMHVHRRLTTNIQHARHFDLEQLIFCSDFTRADISRRHGRPVQRQD